jgi:hypothetical protein
VTSVQGDVARLPDSIVFMTGPCQWAVHFGNRALVRGFEAADFHELQAKHGKKDDVVNRVPHP